MTTLIVYGSRTQHAARSALESLPGAHVVFEVDDHAPRDLLGSQTLVQTFEDVLDDADYEAIDVYVVRFIEQGFEFEGEDLSDWKGISLASAIRGEIYLTLTSIVKTALSAHRAMARHRPDRVLIGDGVGLLRDAWLREARSFGAGSDLLPADPPLRISPRWVSARAKRRRPTFADSRPRKPVAALYSSVAWMLSAFRQLAAGGRTTGVFTGRIGDRELLTRLVRSPHLQARAIVGTAPELIRWLAGAGTARRARREFRQRWKRYAEIAPRTGRFRLGDVELWPHIQPWLERVFERSLPESARLVPAAQADVRAGRPRLLILDANRSPKSHVYTQAARRAGAAIVLRWNEWTGAGRMVHRLPVDADWILAWGEYSGTYFARYGFPDERVVRVGKMGVQEFPRKEPKEHDRLRRELGIPTGAPVVLYADQNYQPSWAAKSPMDYTVRNLDALTGAARRLPSVHFLVRFHPKLGMNVFHEPADALQRRANRLADAALPNVAISPQHWDLGDCMALADAFASSYSTTAVEAMLHGLPTVLLNFTRKAGYWPDLADRFGPIEVQDIDDLISVLEALLGCGEARERCLATQEEYLERLFSRPLDIVSWLEDLVAGAPAFQRSLRATPAEGSTRANGGGVEHAETPEARPHVTDVGSR